MKIDKNTANAYVIIKNTANNTYVYTVYCARIIHFFIII